MAAGQRRGQGKPFQRGQSGNPGGRPKVLDDIKTLARTNGEAAFRKVLALLDSEDERVALAAAQEVLNRAYGKPQQFIETTTKRDLSEMSDAEIIARLRELDELGEGATPSRSDSSARGAQKPDRVH
jgi:hypothetical protein